MRCRGLEPFFRSDSRVLVLGSFPSVMSRRENFYYGNPRNRFWKTVADAAGLPVPTDTEEKKRLLTECRIALWDVVDECEIKGSADSSISSVKTSDIYFLTRNCRIERILLNGRTAAKLFVENFQSLTDISVALPSTSPANTAFCAEPWHAELKNFI